MIARCLLAAILVLSAAARAQEQPAESVAPVVLVPETVKAMDPAPTTSAVVPIKKGAVAPFAGLLVPEARFTKLLLVEIRVEFLENKLWIESKKGQAIEAMYLRRLEQATEPVPWYRTESFARWTGFGLGVVFTGLAIYGTVQLTK